MKSPTSGTLGGALLSRSVPRPPLTVENVWTSAHSLKGSSLQVQDLRNLFSERWHHLQDWARRLPPSSLLEGRNYKLLLTTGTVGAQGTCVRTIAHRHICRATAVKVLIYRDLSRVGIEAVGERSDADHLQTRRKNGAIDTAPRTTTPSPPSTSRHAVSGQEDGEQCPRKAAWPGAGWGRRGAPTRGVYTCLSV